ncbi:MAG: asparaginase [Planctomycetota bacterium]
MKVLVEVTRGGRVESRHHGAYCVFIDGKVDRSKGDIEEPKYFRSAAKPIQAVAVIESGAPERFDFTERELAMVVGSHSGSPMHSGTARGMLERMGEEPEILRCGGHRPLDRLIYEEYVKAGYTWDRLEDNCSGKHAGMIGASKAWGERAEAYAEPDSRVQRENLANVALFSGVAPESIGSGKDGCGVPSFAIPLRAMAQGLARYTTPTGVPESKAAAAMRVIDVTTRNPDMVAGERRFDTMVMRAGRGSLVCKEGAEGVQVIGRVGANLGIAVKIADGAQRAQQAVAASLLVEYGLLPREAVARFMPRPVLSRDGEPVGELQVTL